MAEDKPGTAAQAKAFAEEPALPGPSSVMATGVPAKGQDDADVFMEFYRQHPGSSAYWIGDLLGWTRTRCKKAVSELVDNKMLVHDGDPEFLRVTTKGLKV